MMQEDTFNNKTKSNNLSSTITRVTTILSELVEFFFIVISTKEKLWACKAIEKSYRQYAVMKDAKNLFYNQFK